MKRKSRKIQAILLVLFVGAVFFGIGVVLKLSERVDSIQTAEQSDPLWIGSQLQFEMLRLEREISKAALGFKPATDVALRFDIAWSRIIILQEGELAQVIETFNIDQSALLALEDRFETLEPLIEEFATQDMTDEVRLQRATTLLEALDGFDILIRDFLLALAQAKTTSLTEFRTGLLSLSQAIVYLGATILVLFGIFIALLMLEIRFAAKREKEMRALAEEATSASHLKMNFMSIVSHELRTPLTSLLGGLDLLKARTSASLEDKASLRLLDICSRNGDRLLTLVNDILDAQALSEGKVSVKQELTDLADVVESAVEGCHAYASSLGVHYELSMPPGHTLALTDSARVSQVLSNLLSNAAKFTSSGDVVTVTLERIGHKARIEVTDRGIGIPVEKQKDLFKAFHQVNPGTTGANKSSGLGLSITKQLMDLLGGSVGFRSTEGEGSTFWIELELLTQTPIGCCSQAHPETEVSSS